MIQNLQKLGCTITEKTQPKYRTLLVTGLINKIDQKSEKKQKALYINTGNAGTTTRFILAIATLLNKKIILNGSKRMQQRPIAEEVTALNELGAHITYQKTHEKLPIIIHPRVPQGGKVTINAQSTSQFGTSILLIAPFLQNTTTVAIKNVGPSKTYLSSTLKLLQEWGLKYEQKNSSKWTCTFQTQSVKGQRISILEDISSASYLMGAAILNNKNIEVNITDYESPLHPEREFLSVLKQPSIRTIDASTIPDTALTLAMIAALTPGKTTLTNIHHLRYKECDRLKALQQELEKLHIRTTCTPTSLAVWGTSAELPSASIKTYDDHRIALAFSILKSRFPHIIIENPEVVQKSYPKYWEDYRDFTLSLNTNIVLIGMPGSGKSSLGQALAKKWKYQYLDLDRAFEKNVQTTIAQFVEIHGWEAFRKKETEILRNLKPKSKTIISTGGGVVLKKANAPLLKKLGTIVFLESTQSNTLHHLEHDPRTQKQRPNLRKDTKKNLRRMYQERTRLYHALGQITIPTMKETSRPTDDIHAKIQSLEYQLFYTRS